MNAIPMNISFMSCDPYLWMEFYDMWPLLVIGVLWHVTFNCDWKFLTCDPYLWLEFYDMWPLLVIGVFWHVTLTCDWSFMTCDPYLWLEFSVKIRKYSSITFSPSSNHWKNNKTNKMIVVLFTVDKSLQI